MFHPLKLRSLRHLPKASALIVSFHLLPCACLDTPAQESTEPSTIGRPTDATEPAANSNVTQSANAPSSEANEAKAKTLQAQLAAFKAGGLMKGKKYREAVQEYKRAYALQPDIKYALGYASAAHQAEDWFGAIDAYKQIYKLDPSKKDVLKTTAECLVKIGQYEEAVTMYKECLPFEKDKSDIWQRIATIRLGQRDFPETIDAYRQAIKANPKDGQPYSLLANLLWREGKKSEAMSIYKDGVANFPKDGALQEAYAYALMSEKDWHGAANAYKTAAGCVGASKRVTQGYQSAMQRIAQEEQLAKHKTHKRKR